MVRLPSERVVLARHSTPTGELQLQQRPLGDGTQAFEIIWDGVFLMASYSQSSERALARCALAGLRADVNESLRILVGGLGMGYTLQEVLKFNATSVDVFEISSDIIDWNQSYFSCLNGNSLGDARVRVVQDDIYSVLCELTEPTYHAVVLDVDNGPAWLARGENSRLYATDTLVRWLKVLNPGGRFAVWSAQRDLNFLERLQTVFSNATEIPIRTSNYKQQIEVYYIYRAAKSLT